MKGSGRLDDKFRHIYFLKILSVPPLPGQSICSSCTKQKSKVEKGKRVKEKMVKGENFKRNRHCECAPSVGYCQVCFYNNHYISKFDTGLVDESEDDRKPAAK